MRVFLDSETHRRYECIAACFASLSDLRMTSPVSYYLSDFLGYSLNVTGLILHRRGIL